MTKQSENMSKVKNIVLVHGFWTDASSYSQVIPTTKPHRSIYKNKRALFGLQKQAYKRF